MSVPRQAVDDATLCSFACCFNKHCPGTCRGQQLHTKQIFKHNDMAKHYFPSERALCAARQARHAELALVRECRQSSH